MLGVWLLNIAEKDQLDRIRDRLAAQINKIPERVASGSIQETREWLNTREEAQKMLRKTNVNAAQLLTMISRLQ